MTHLLNLLRNQIEVQGPLSIAEYMALCLGHPEHGYYATRDPLGQGGDFTTAPEISQMFGELVGLSIAQAWLDQGQPDPFVLAELGPGRGTLMADALRATSSVAGFHDAAQLCLVESSPVLREFQSRQIKRKHRHFDTLAEVPEAPLFIIANEFFDALPTRQYQRSEGGWRERVIGLRNDRLTFGLTDLCNPEFLSHRLSDTDEDKIVEYSQLSAHISGEIGSRIAKFGGAGIIVDYGDWRSLGDTLQAIKAHQAVDPLATPGTADLTTHVDFELLSVASEPARSSRLTPQGIFLERLGITERAQILAKNLEDKALNSHIAAHRRLTHPEEMGTLFKVLGLYPDGAPPPPGVNA